MLDENIEHEVYHWLENYGHELLHVEVSDKLSKGDADERLAEISRLNDWIIVTYDDFRDDFTDNDYQGVLYFTDLHDKIKNFILTDEIVVFDG